MVVQHNKQSRGCFSIAMATFNGGIYLKEQLESIAIQSVQPMELIICDDGSIDDTISIIEDFSKSAHFPVRLFKNSYNLGSTLNFYKVIRFCQAEIVVLCDQDDVWRIDKLKQIQDILKNEPSVVGVFSDATLINNIGRNLGKTLWDTLRLSLLERRNLECGEILAFKTLLKRNIITGAAFAFRRNSFLTTCGAIPDSWVHDAWIAINLTREGSIKLIPQCLINYRQHESNQIGLKKKSVRHRFNDYKIPQTIYNMRLLRDHLVDQHEEKKYIALVDAKVKHLEVRQAPFNNVFLLFKEFLSSGYNKYSAGTSSFAKDIVRFFIK